MWKSTSEEAARQSSAPEPRPKAPATNASSQLATLGPSLVIRGTLSGEEDLLIEGRVEGEISLRKHSVTVGSKGRVEADIFSKSICVEGEVAGNLFGEDQVVIRRSGKVRGNVTSPRVSLEDGSRFKGAIDMKAPSASGDERPSAPAQSKKSTGAGQETGAGRSGKEEQSPGRSAAAGS